VNTNIIEALNIDKSKFTTLDYLIGLGHLLILIFHFYAIIFLFSHIRRFKELKILKIGLLILGVISLFALGGEKVLVDEIAREYQLGSDVSERYILNFAYLINMVFIITSFLFILKSFRLIETGDPTDKLV
jgi:hypothetical protein